MLLGELDLLALLRGGRAGIKQGESQERREQRTQKVPTISNERHDVVLRLDHRLHSTIRSPAPAGLSSGIQATVQGSKLRDEANAQRTANLGHSRAARTKGPADLPI